MTLEQTFLALTAVGLIPVALSYGASPFKMTKLLYKADINDNIAHIFRGIMGIYLAMITAWLLGTFSSTFTLPALFTLVFFMYGVAFGRIISFVQEKTCPRFVLSLLDFRNHPRLNWSLLISNSRALIGLLISNEGAVTF